MFDSHCHLDFDALRPDLEGLLSGARAAGIRGWLVPGCRPTQWANLPKVKAQGGDIYVGVGLHPYFTTDVSSVDSLCADLERAVRELGAVAVGETGLDKGRGAPLGRQSELFDAQLSLARQLDLPIVIHQVGAQRELLGSLGRVGLPRPGGVVHGFSGDVAWGRALISRGLLLGVGTGVVHHRRKKLRDALASLPLERMLLETDAPDQGVEPGRGVPNDLLLVADALGLLHQRPGRAVGEITERSARELFQLRSA